MLIAMDGNNSLKRLRRDGGAKDETDVRLSRCALPDSRTAPGDYYVTRAQVDEWEKNVIKKNPQLESISLWQSYFCYLPYIKIWLIGRWREHRLFK